MMATLFKRQQEKLLTGFDSVQSQLTLVQETLNVMGVDIGELHSRISRLENDSEMRGECQKAVNAVKDMEERMQEYTKTIDGNLDKLEGLLKKGHLKF